MTDDDSMKQWSKASKATTILFDIYADEWQDLFAIVVRGNCNIDSQFMELDGSLSTCRIDPNKWYIYIYIYIGQYWMICHFHWWCLWYRRQHYSTDLLKDPVSFTEFAHLGSYGCVFSISWWKSTTNTGNGSIAFQLDEAIATAQRLWRLANSALFSGWFRQNLPFPWNIYFAARALPNNIIINSRNKKMRVDQICHEYGHR